MKRIGILLLCALLLAGCAGKNTGSRVPAATGVADVLKAGMEEEDKKKAESGPAAEASAPSGTDAAETAGRESPETSDARETEEKTAPSAGDVAVDLSLLSGTMVYSQVYQIVTKPEDFVGKILKISGLVVTFYDDDRDKYYFTCIIQDATACCAQGIEFVLTDDYRMPEDYPTDGDEVTVTGRFDYYVEDGITYGTLRDAVLN